MSDRGYIALSLEMKARAIEAEIEGMKAFNKRSELDGNVNMYGQQDFDAKAAELNDLADQVRALVPNGPKYDKPVPRGTGAGKPADKGTGEKP